MNYIICSLFVFLYGIYKYMYSTVLCIKKYAIQLGVYKTQWRNGKNRMNKRKKKKAHKTKANIQWRCFRDVFWEIIELAAHWDVNKHDFLECPSFVTHPSLPSLSTSPLCHVASPPIFCFIWHFSHTLSFLPLIFNVNVFKLKYFYHPNLFSKFYIAACNSILLFSLCFFPRYYCYCCALNVSSSLLSHHRHHLYV